MTHLIATTSLAQRLLSKPLDRPSLGPGSWLALSPGSVRMGPQRLLSSSLTNASSPTSAAVFFCHMQNFLEKRGAEFHYSVIGQIATVLLASGYVGGHLLNEDDAASNSEVEVPAACAELTPSLAQKTAINDVVIQPDQFIWTSCAFEPVKES